MSESTMHGATAREVSAILASATSEELPALLERYAGDPRRQVAAAVASARKRLERDSAERERVAGLYAFQRELAGPGIVIGGAGSDPARARSYGGIDWDDWDE